MHNALGKSNFSTKKKVKLICSDLFTILEMLPLFFNSQEEIESLREKMMAQSSLVIVGSSDDALRVKRLNRVMQGVTQSMIDNMIVVCISFLLK